MKIKMKTFLFRVSVFLIVHFIYRDRIVWLKRGTELRNKDKYKISRKGILKITELSSDDNTTFTCKGKI